MSDTPDRAKKTYYVQVPIAGSLIFTVESEDEAAALDAVWNMDWSLNIETKESVELGEFELMEHVTRGNVCHAPLNSVDIEEVE